MPHKDPEKRREYKKAYTIRNKNHKKEYDKKYNQANKVKKTKNSLKWAKENRGRRKDIMDKWLDNNPDNRRSITLKSNYGITLESYNQLFEKQRGCCAICQKHQSQLKRRLHVDHDHLTGIVRELICQHCNSAIGLLQDSLFITGSALQYLMRHRVLEKPEWQLTLAKRKK